MLPHLDAAYNLARWLTRDDHAAQDVVQEAYLRALKFFGSFRGGDGRAWILTIVRNACFDWLKQRRSQDLHEAFDEEVHTPHADRSGGAGGSAPRGIDPAAGQFAAPVTVPLPSAVRDLALLDPALAGGDVAMVAHAEHDAVAVRRFGDDLRPGDPVKLPGTLEAIERICRDAIRRAAQFSREETLIVARKLYELIQEFRTLEMERRTVCDR